MQKLNGLYVITDNVLTPNETLLLQVETVLNNGVKIVQLRDKINDQDTVKKFATQIQELCKKYNALFVLNDDIDLAIQLQCDGLHIGKSDHARFDEIREKFHGIIGVSCYGSIDLALEFEAKGADYVAFGSFYPSPTKPNSNIVPLEVIEEAKKKLQIPVCAIGGINLNNLDQVLEYHPDMVCAISGIWDTQDLENQTKKFTKKINEERLWKKSILL